MAPDRLAGPSRRHGVHRARQPQGRPPAPTSTCWRRWVPAGAWRSSRKAPPRPATVVLPFHGRIVPERDRRRRAGACRRPELSPGRRHPLGSAGLHRRHQPDGLPAAVLRTPGLIARVSLAGSFTPPLPDRRHLAHRAHQAVATALAHTHMPSRRRDAGAPME
jgi:glyoxylase-like metal-dependent hydrolase (beta-lactamase superfamily II)